MRRSTCRELVRLGCHVQKNATRTPTVWPRHARLSRHHCRCLLLLLRNAAGRVRLLRAQPSAAPVLRRPRAGC